MVKEWLKKLFKKPHSGLSPDNELLPEARRTQPKRRSLESEKEFYRLLDEHDKENEILYRKKQNLINCPYFDDDIGCNKKCHHHTIGANVCNRVLNKVIINRR